MPYKNPEDKKANQRRWWTENQQHLIRYRLETKKSRSETHRRWRKNNLEKRAADMRAWRSVPENRLASNLRSRISNVLQGRTKSASTLRLLGCSWEHFKAWLEFWMQPGMTWENYGQWEVDHKIPCDNFDLAKDDQQRECFNYRNLQPLWMAENRIKGNRL